MVKSFPNFLESHLKQFLAKIHSYDKEKMGKIEEFPHNESFTKKEDTRLGFFSIQIARFKELFKPNPNFESFMNQKIFKI